MIIVATHRPSELHLIPPLSPGPVSRTVCLAGGGEAGGAGCQRPGSGGGECAGRQGGGRSDRCAARASADPVVKAAVTEKMEWVGEGEVGGGRGGCNNESFSLYMYIYIF